LALLMGLVWNQGHDMVLATARWLFFAIMVFWGFGPASSTIVAEIQDGTWDQQRMSALAPWTLTWGKLLGTTAYGWYGGSLCLAVFILVSGMEGRLFSKTFVVEVLLWIIVAFLGSAVAMLFSFAGHVGKRAGAFGAGIVPAILVSGPVFFLGTQVPDAQTLDWWSFEISTRQFFMGSACFFMGCGIFALWRMMRIALQLRALPWDFPLFLVLLALYLTGFEYAWTAVPFCLALLSLLATYGLLVFHNPDERVEITLKRLIHCSHTGHWHRLLETVPMWSVTLVMVLFCTLATLVFPPETVSEMDFLSRLGSSISGAMILFVGFIVALRDTCVYLFLALSRHAGKKTHIVLVLYLVIVHIILPSFTFATPSLTGIIQPLSFRSGLGTALTAAVFQLLAGVALLSWRVSQLDRQQG
ncbi:ABC transporter permease, partial [Desulfosarcina sp. OttesenSCG-928-B08]|nr:ABC transporter permease [Desulfosarcina sp. OttesenSCG-928-B08]